jgi:hypothetical protein
MAVPQAAVNEVPERAPNKSDISAVYPDQFSL